MRLDKVEKDIEVLYSKINNHAVTLAAVNEKLCSVLVTLGELKESIDSIQKAPAKRWEQLVSAIISVAVSGIAGFVIGRIFQ